MGGNLTVRGGVSFEMHPGQRIAPSEITPPEVFFDRRRFISAALAATGTAAWPEGSGSATAQPPGGGASLPALRFARNARHSVQEPATAFEHVMGYNNFYEFGTEKTDPAAHAGALRIRPWSVTIAGEAEVTGTRTLEDILQPHALEERVYRLRCVERWSMVVPWVGFPLGDLLRRFRPTSRARYIEFTTLHDPRQMPGQRRAVLDWPYVEGLRIDEAMHPLTLLVVGVYGRALPNQNGAPLRLVVPWKYGFKSIKSIVRIDFRETQPRTSWNLAAPQEYGFHANVNPEVDHPRWSQAKERRIGAPLFAPLRPTQLFNGYAEQVAGLYRGMDLRKHF